ncbi:unnamed protein product [Calypogeia fissa]
MESDKHDGGSRPKKISTKHGFLITAFGGGVFIALIIVTMIVYSKKNPEISMFDRDYHIIAVLGAFMIAHTLLSVAFAYLTTKNPNGKFFQCFGCCMTEGEIPQNITPPGTGVEYNFHSSNQPPAVLEENFTRDLEAAAGVIQGVGKESEKGEDRGSRSKKLSIKHGYLITAFFGVCLIALITIAIFHFHQQIPNIPPILFDIVAACGGLLILFILVGIILAYLTSMYPNGKLLSCFGCYDKTMMEDEKLEKMTDPSPPPHHAPASTESELHRNSFSNPADTSKAFKYEELLAATNGFAPSNLLGSGGFGTVYKGTIAGDLVAVKQLKIGSRQGEREFRAEVDIISRVHHRHLVSLVGHCISDSHRLLVYNFVPNGTLYEALHGAGKPVMGWNTRMGIALGIARGLAYLHEDCHPRIIHRDIKGSNILLDSQWKAQVADFGLAKLAEDGQSHVSTRVMGTFGYMAPEYAMSGKLTDKSDVYSFGVVLLELITGKKYIHDQGGEKVSLVERARPLLSQALGARNVEALADPKLMDTYDKKEMFRMVEVAANCVRHSAERRPKMAVVLRALDTKDADLAQEVRPGYSGEFAGEKSMEFRPKAESPVVDESSGQYDLGV